jgi:hypothetical protein
MAAQASQSLNVFSNFYAWPLGASLLVAGIGVSALALISRS